MLKRRPAKVHVWEDFWGERAPERGRRPHQFRQWIAQQARERGLVGELPSFDGARGELPAEINRGWWIVKCPDPTCNSAVVANDQHRYFMCVKCGNEANGGQWYRVKFPPQRAQIEARINAAPDWKARFWEPGWSLERLDLFITTAHRSYTAPQTWVAGQIVDESDLNTDIRDNMLETAVAKATTAGRFFRATGTNAIAEDYADLHVLAETELSGSAANIDFTSIVTGFRSLLIIARLRSDNASNTVNLNLRFNNDSAANYDEGSWTGSDTSNPASTGAQAQTAGRIGLIPAASASANLFGSVEILVPDYLDATIEKIARGKSGLKISTGAGGIQLGDHVAAWRSGAAVTRITLIPSLGSFIAGCVATLCGIQGA